MNKTKLFLIFLIITFFLFLPSTAYAVKFDLIAPKPPAGGFTRGQTVQFTINVDTQGETVKSTQIGMTYNTRYLEYVSTTPGNAMTSVSTNNLGEGKLIFSGENQSGFSGQGTFAYVNLKIIAQAPGETQLCVLWNPQNSPTSSPRSTSPSPQPTSPSQPNSPLPNAGEVKGVYTNSFLGLIFISFFLLFFWLKRIS
jgi:hypothetical protein